MSYQPYYTLTDWKNLPSTSTPINRKNLFNAEQGIKEADNRIVQLDAKKAEQSLVNTMVRDVTLDAKTGILTVTLQNGTKKSYDLDIERVVTNFDINDNNELVLTLADGTQKVIDLTRFVYSIANTATVSMQIKNRVITATVVDGSITMEKLDSAIQSEFRQYMLDAQAARDAALQYQKFAKRYAVGDEDFPGSEADNAKRYYEQSKANAETAAQNAVTSTEKAAIAVEQAGIATQKATNASASANSASADAQIATDKAALSIQSANISTEKAQIATEKASLATEKAVESTEKADLSKRYAIGGVEQGDSEDNAEWFYQQSMKYYRLAQEIVNINYPNVSIDIGTGHLMTEGGSGIILSLDESGHLITEASVA